MSLASLTTRSFCYSDNGPWVAEQSCSGFKGLSKDSGESVHASRRGLGIYNMIVTHILISTTGFEIMSTGLHRVPSDYPTFTERPQRCYHQN
jgi:hypothetical protein